MKPVLTPRYGPDGKLPDRSNKELTKYSGKLLLRLIRVANIELLGVIAELENCKANYGNAAIQKKLFLLYRTWDKRVTKTLLNTHIRYIAFLNEWLLIEEPIYELKNIGAFKTLLHQKKKVLDALQKHLDSIKVDAPINKGTYDFMLTRDALLYRTVGSTTEQYQMKKGSMRHKIILALCHIKRNTGWSTIELLKKINAKNARAVRTAVSQIRDQIRKKFTGISGQDFIKGTKLEGYRVGENITITPGS